MNKKEYWNYFHKENRTYENYDVELVKFLKRFYPDRESKINFLDLGCGQGANIIPALNIYKNWVAYGIDSSSRALCVANGILIGDYKRVKLKNADIMNSGYKDNQFDLVFDVNTLTGCENYFEIIKEVFRVLKPKGRFYIKELTDNECNKTNKFITKENINFFTEKQLYDIFCSNGFERVETSLIKDKDLKLEHVICIGRKI